MNASYVTERTFVYEKKPVQVILYRLVNGKLAYFTRGARQAISDGAVSQDLIHDDACMLAKRYS